VDDAIRRVVETAYDAATGGASWQQVGNGLKQAVGARTASLWFGDPAAGRVEILYTESMPDEAGADYSRHFYAKDPWVGAFSNALAQMPEGFVPDVALGHELLPLDAYRRGEFYQDFARQLGLYHLVAATYPLGADGIMPLGLHRPEGTEPFGEVERHILRRAMPHLHHAVRIKLRLAGGVAAPSQELGTAALEAFAVGAIIVDASLRVVHANAAAQALARPDGPLRLRQAGPVPSQLHLEAVSRADAARLGRLCRAVALRASLGGGLCLTDEDGPDGARLALLVTPLAARFLPRRWGAAREGMLAGYALVLVRDLARLPQVPPLAAGRIVRPDPGRGGGRRRLVRRRDDRVGGGGARRGAGDHPHPGPCDPGEDRRPQPASAGADAGPAAWRLTPGPAPARER